MATITAGEFRSRVATLPEDIDKILVFASQTSCSDVFIEVGRPATIYRFGILYQTTVKTSEREWHQFVDRAITSELNTQYVRQKMLDFSYTVKQYRYRVNCSYSCGKNIATFRMISNKLPTFQELSIPKELQALLKRAFEQPSSISLISAATGQGKALLEDTKLWSEIDGRLSQKKMKELSLGDTVFNRYGKPVKVIGIYPQGKRDVYRLYLRDGRYIDADINHRFTILKKGKAKEEIIETSDLINASLCNEWTGPNGSKHHDYKYWVPIQAPLQSPDIDLPLDPWLLGYLIGNGCFMQPATLSVATDDAYVKKQLNVCLKDYGAELHIHKANKYNYNIVPYRPIKDRLENLGLWGHYSYEKFIPAVYMQAGTRQRMDLFRGLMDADGAVTSKGGASYSTCSKKLAKDVMFLAISLGYTYHVHHDRRDKYKNSNGIAYEIRINGVGKAPFSLPRKVARWNSKCSRIAHMKRFHYMPIVKIEKLNKQRNTICIKVDDDTHTFSTAYGFVSHNSTTLAACVNTFSASKDAREEKKPLRDAHLITLEDPIEYIFPTRSGTLIQQKELRRDFMSYELGIVSSLREHPTHILLGEIRDTTTIKAAIEASRTGHNVFTTFHTSNVADTITRLYDNIQASNNVGLIFDLIANLNFILCQRLLKGRQGYTFDYQHLFFTEQVKKVIFKALYENQNISDVIEKLVKNPKLQQASLSSDWKIKQ